MVLFGYIVDNLTVCCATWVLSTVDDLENVKQLALHYEPSFRR